MNFPSIAVGFTALAFFALPLNAHAIDLELFENIVPDGVMIELIEDCGYLRDNATAEEEAEHDACVSAVLDSARDKFFDSLDMS